MMCQFTPSTLIAVIGRFRFHSILYLAAFSALPSSSALAQQIVTIDDTRYSDVYGNSNDGGSTANTDPNGNTLNIVAGADIRYAYGAYTENNGIDATNNTVNMSGGKVSGTIYGGWSDSGNAVGNTVEISGEAVVGDGTNWNGNVYGGYSEQGHATGNRVTISGGEVGWYVYGGHGFSGHATGNSVKISGGSVRYAWGGHSAYGNVANNSVEISGGSVRYVWGGRSGSGTAMGNSVTISGGKVEWDVYGGHAFSYFGNAIGNSVTVSGGSVEWHVIGGWSEGGSNMGNSVTISGGEVKGNVVGGRNFDSNARDNIVNISGGTVGRNVLGGHAYGDAIGNSVTISGGRVGDGVTLNTGNVYGGRSSSGNATGNTVTLSAGSVDGNIYGGYIDYIDEGSGSVTGNSVTISGGTVGGNIYGGYIDDIYEGSGNVTGNTVTISGTPDLTASGIYGGYIGSGGGDVFTGNTLNLYGASQPGTTPKLLHTITAKGLANFQNLNFYVPDSAKDGDVMLKITGTADITDSRLKVVFDVANSSLKSFDKITLIDTSSSGAKLVGLPESMELSPTRGVQSLITQARKGALMLVDVEITVEHESGIPDTEGQLNLYILGGARLLPEAGTVNDGYLPGLMQLNQGGNLVAGQTLAGKMLCAAKHPGFLDLGVFCDISGNWSRYHTNAQTDLSGTNLLLGVSRCFKLKPFYSGGQVTQLMLGGFFEHGNGSYDSLSAFGNGVNVRAGGKLDSYGGGVLGRWDFGKFRIRQDYAHSYIDGSFRAGSLRNRFHSDLCDSFDMPAGFTSNSPYHGTHVGVGRVRHFASGATFDLSGKYFWTHMQGESLKLTTGDPVDFESVNSHRFRLGGRYNFVPNSRLTPYLGGVWEREFGGTARASTQGFALSASSLRGDTGIGEVGIALKPATSRGYCIDLGVQCYGGKRDGVSAALNIGRNF